LLLASHRQRYRVATVRVLRSILNAPATTELYTLSLHDALPIYLQGYDSAERARLVARLGWHGGAYLLPEQQIGASVEHLHFYEADRKSTRLNSSHVKNSYAVFCLKKKRQLEYIGLI